MGEVEFLQLRCPHTVPIESLQRTEEVVGMDAGLRF
jgi:hypothetical protein